jgi:AraC family transcriptional regulator
MTDYEFVWIVEGDSEYTVDGVTHPCPPGAIIFCRAKTTDAFRWDPHKRTRHGYFHFNILSVPDAWPSPQEWAVVRMPSEGDILRPLFRYMLTWSAGGNKDLLKLTIAQMLTAFVIGQIDCTEMPQDALPDPIERTLAHIHSRLEEDPAAPIHLADLAEVSMVTPEHLCRLFKAAQLHSPMETCRLARLDRAMVFMMHSNYSIGEVARLCGYASQFHFSRRFKQAYNKSPSQVRQDVKTGAAVPMTKLVRWAPRISTRTSAIARPET